MLALRWIRDEGGLMEMNRRNTQKANVLYAEIDRNPLFKGSVLPEFRSTMNACFKAISPEIEAKFIAFAEKRGIVGIKGFPTVGGFRASMYNAMPLESVQFLVETMQAFSRDYELMPRRKMVLAMSI